MVEQKILEKTGVLLEEPTPKRKRTKATDFRITQGMLRNHGKTQGCIGCDQAGDGTHAKHNDVCRQRFEQIMEGDDAMKERLLREEIRKQAREIEAEEEEPVTSPTPQSASSTRPEQSQQAESSSSSSPTPKSVDRGADITSRTRKRRLPTTRLNQRPLNPRKEDLEDWFWRANGTTIRHQHTNSSW